jgi:FKBP-type peptidyl-prolyl cis-trans isomerase
MTQTVNGQNKTPQKRTRPGQRQQERLQRQARRSRRRRIWFSTVTALVLIAVGVAGVVEYQQYTAQQAAAATKIKNLHATATANVQATGSAIAHVTATSEANAKATADVKVTATAVAKVLLTATDGSPIPTSGPATPPAVSGTPITMTTGLQYIDIKEGTGPAAKEGSTVDVEYTGWLQSSGKKFDSSYDRGAQPFEVSPLGQANIIPGWNKGLVGMKAGGTRRLIISPDLAYGAQGSPPVIPANATLIFDVTVISVK